MPFQQTVFPLQGQGMIGGIYSNAPIVTTSYIINSASQANNLYGSVFTKDNSTGSGTNILNVAAGRAPSSTISFAGFLVNPKVQASFGNPIGAPLSPTLQLYNGQVGEFLTRGFIYVFLPAPANAGDYIAYNNSTGLLTSYVGGITSAAPPSGYSFAHARVEVFNVGASGLSVIEVIDVPYQERTTP